MGSGYSKLYSGAYQGEAVPGSIDYMKPTDNFSRNIKRRVDIDPDGYIDVIAHGNPKEIQIINRGEKIKINHRLASKLIIKNKDFNNKRIRLFSCNTGFGDMSFAQNLANKLGVIVEAPTKLVWAYPSGRYIVADRRSDLPKYPDLNKRGKFIKFYPGGNKK